jgi:small subunit ribosomal protein S1
LKKARLLTAFVKNITDYGAFVDLGGIDGLLHVTDMAWRRVNHPSEILSIGQQVKVQIIRINQETHRISLGMKQLESDPWDGIGAKYPTGKKISGTVTNITDYGAFVELEPGIEGLIHISEMSWTKKNVHPGKILSTKPGSRRGRSRSRSVEAPHLARSQQTLENPWQAFAHSHPAGTEVEGEVKNKTEFGLFIGLDGDVDGMVHLSDLDWNRPGEQVIEEFNKGDVVKAVVLDVDVDKERISLGIKQLGKDAVGDAAASGDLRKNAVVSAEVIAINDGGIEVRLVNHEDLTSFIRRNDLSRDRDEQRPERFSVGQTVDARVLNFSKKDRKIQLSIKALEIAEEKEAVAQFGSSDSGASLGDILGAALKNRNNAE